MDPKKVFSEQEAAQLIVDAAKLQESAGQHDYTPGVTWAELQRMADDVGVDPDYLKKALAKKSTNSKPTVKPKSFLGMPVSEEFERVVDAELPPDRFDIVAGEFYSMGGGTAQTGYGGPTVIGRMIKGTFYEGCWYGNLEVSSRHGRTRIKANTSNAIAIWAVWTPIVFLTFMFGVIITASKFPANLPIALAIWGALSAGLWASLGATLRKDRAKVEAKLDRMSEEVLEEAEALRSNLEKTRPVSINDEPDLRESLGREGTAHEPTIF